QRRRAQLTGEIAERSTVLFDSPAANEAVNREGARMVRSLVEALPEEQKQALTMAFFDGLTQQEIADTLQQPLGTVKARIRRRYSQGLSSNPRFSRSSIAALPPLFPR